MHPGSEIVFTNPGALTQKVAGKVTLENDGRIILSESVTDQRNPSLCDIFFGISAMERAGTGLIDVGELMLAGGGGSAFYHNPAEARFKAIVTQPMASAGSRGVARSAVPTGLYVLNVLPFSVIPEKCVDSAVDSAAARPAATIDLRECGTFVDTGRWNCGVSCRCPFSRSLLDPIVDKKTSKCGSCGRKSKPRRIQSASCRGSCASIWSINFVSFEEQRIDSGRRSQAPRLFRGKEQRRTHDRVEQCAKARQSARSREETRRPAEEPGSKMKALVTRSSISAEHGACGSSRSTCSQADACTPLPAFTRAAKATRRIKFDRNKSVEADLTFWANFLGRGAETMNVGDLHVDDC